MREVSHARHAHSRRARRHPGGGRRLGRGNRRREGRVRLMASERTMKTFSLHWGSGVVEEEVQIATPYHRPTIQLLKFTEGKAKGSYEIRFCTYDHSGRFQRMPL